MQWLLAVVIYSSFIKSTLTSFTPVVQKSVQTRPVPINLATNVPVMVVVLLFAVSVIILAVYVFMKIPSAVAKTSKKIVHEVAESSVPIVLHAQHLPQTKQNERKVIFRMTVLIKVLIILLPIIAAYCSQFIASQVLQFSVSMYLSLLLAACTTVFFLLQYVVARLLSVVKQELW
ncbi:hypothetical protein EPN95_00780 [Patescibacteria group bacterium]|nr:MAG: hypothetical protein EPN95_00780 [Patescibacteria group bacterium]